MNNNFYSFIFILFCQFLLNRHLLIFIFIYFFYLIIFTQILPLTSSHFNRLSVNAQKYAFFNSTKLTFIFLFLQKRTSPNFLYFSLHKINFFEEKLKETQNILFSQLICLTNCKRLKVKRNFFSEVPFII